MNIRVDLTKGIYEPPEMEDIVKNARARVFIDGEDVSSRCVAADTVAGRVKLQILNDKGQLYAHYHPQPHILTYENLQTQCRRAGNDPRFWLPLYPHHVPLTDLFLFRDCAYVPYCYRYGVVTYEFLDAVQ